MDGLALLAFRERSLDRAKTIRTLEGEHPAGVFRRQGANFVKLFDLIRGELEFDGREVIG